MSNFQPPRDWDAIYAASKNYFFGEEPSQIARAAWHGFQMFGGLAENATALDLGSGEGRDTAFLAGAGFRVIARDVSPTGLEKTRALLARRNVLLERVELALADVRLFDYPPNAYDLALAANVYQFLPPDEAPGHIERLKAAVKPGGICAVGVFSPAMAAWGAEIDGFFTATADELLTYFPKDGDWLPLDRTEYWTYRPQEATMASFAYVVARKQAPK
ncbi:MAG: class I SAM-dependent methyltransferase [Armatimonadota bacterium]|nr:class I SAM-dependent methyltransferase [Armatimonadota bacterium]